ncbi:MAG: phosphopyruvate hydratase [Rhodospirillales bacterium]|nr:phosphopyruvate hydratase [Rhodospirillales bacterium]
MPDTTIRGVQGRRIWDSRGHPTVEADVILAGGTRGRAAAPAGASRGGGEAIDLRDGGAALGGRDVAGALRALNGPVRDALMGADAADQLDVDRILAELGGEGFAKIGGNTSTAVSLAVLDAAARAHGLARWELLAGDSAPLLPLPEIQLLGGGAHAARALDLQDIMVMPVGASSFAEALRITGETYRAAGQLLADTGRLAGVADEGGYWPVFDSNQEALAFAVQAIEAAGLRPGADMALSLDIAANQLHEDGRYRLRLEDRELEPGAFADELLGWCREFPVISIEDPLAEDDEEGMVRFVAAVDGRAQVVGDDFLVTDAKRTTAAAEARAATALLVKPNQAGTVTRSRDALDAARAAGWGIIVSARSGETEDVSVTHLAVGWRAGQMKVGSFARSERMAKWNEALRIEERAGADARFAGRAAVVAPRFGA